MCVFQSHQSNNRHTFGVFVDTLENEIATHLSQIVLIVPLFGDHLEIIWFELRMIQSSFRMPLI